MSLVTPLFLLFGLLAIPVLLLYMLRLRRKEVPISSTILWQRVVRDREANAPWQRLRRNILLILQLLILAALVVALARPFLPVQAVVSGSIVILLDGSASMLATDVDPNRFAAAKYEVRKLVDDLAGNDRATLILVGKTPSVVVSASGDRAELRQTLDELQAAPAVADWPAAIALASGAVQGFEDARIVIVSDGGLPDSLPPVPAELVFVPVGSSGENLAISALATQTSVNGSQLYLGVRNYGAANKDTIISVSFDGTLFDSRRILVPAGERSNLAWDLPDGVALIEAQLTGNEDDNLVIDDKAWTVHTTSPRKRTLIVSEGNRFLETVFSVLPDVNAFRARPGAGPILDEDDAFDLIILDSVPLPDPLPSAPLLIINPVASSVNGEESRDDLFTVTGTFSNTEVTRIADSPLLQFVDWSKVDIRQAKTLDAPWAQSLITGVGGSLLLVGEQNGQRIAILPFRLQESDLPLQIAFPVLIANITGWLSPSQGFDAPVGFLPGDPIIIRPGVDSDTIAVRKPDGTIWTEAVDDNSVAFAETNQLGLYEVSRRSTSGEHYAGSFAINLFAPDESRLSPAITLKIGQEIVEAAGQENVGQRELWPWLAAIALLVLLVEWWVYHRGARWPDIGSGRYFFQRISRRR